ncbi:mitochondrial Rho GTPase 1-like isoform X2 [Ruditapes philippinarum]|uniref:mitochondrial Rho GTPase 1-like isoform X2 n=1 Tax=Ruditapes philippinarum TaxID=129788 RepID=UPI00295B5FD7|nr:mitochondrial Rho GTPase 1-like isoform X2 [Ruditapes philippinarum]
MTSKTDVRILLVGDSGVGKTSLILSLVSEEFNEEVPAKAEEITIPADVTPERVPTHIVDFSSREQSEDDLIEEVKKAHVICIVYAVNDEDSMEGITSTWLPFIRKQLGEDAGVPVILVGNKGDLIDYSTGEAMEPIMQDFAEVETTIECSAKSLRNISELFYYAQKAVLYPMTPLFNPAEKDLTQKCKMALQRVFRICDLDGDQILRDDEVNLFQRKCFDTPLQTHMLDEVKELVRRSIPDGVTDMGSWSGFTVKGFLHLFVVFVHKGRIETPWTVLRKFGYDDNLLLRNDILAPKLNIGVGSTTELSDEGVKFLTMLFNRYDEDRDGVLSPTELTNLFCTCPMLPWGPDVNNTVVTNMSGWVTLQGYLAQWTLTTLLDHPRSLEYLAYLGYHYHHDSTLTAIQVTRDKKIDLEKRQTARNVFRCHVLGPKGVGKTSFLQGLLGRNLRYVATLNKEQLSSFTINTVQVYGQEKYLMLHEVDVAVSDMLSPTETNCDVACLLYDVTNPRSFEFCARMYMKHFLDSRVPTLIVACKVEHPEVRQDYETTPAAFCNKFKLSPPQRFTCIDKVNKDVYIKLATMAAYPDLKDLVLANDKRLLKIGLGVVTVTGVGFIVYKVVKNYSQ